jgi:hypothetical protein
LNCRNIPSKKGPKIESSESHLRDNESGTAIGRGGLSFAWNCERRCRSNYGCRKKTHQYLRIYLMVEY